MYDIVHLDVLVKYLTAYRYFFQIIEHNNFLHNELIQTRGAECDFEWCSDINWTNRSIRSMS